MNKGLVESELCAAWFPTVFLSRLELAGTSNGSTIMFRCLLQVLFISTGILLGGCVIDALMPGFSHNPNPSPLTFSVEEGKGLLIVDGYPMSYLKGYEEGWKVGRLGRPEICPSSGDCVRTIDSGRLRFPLTICPSDQAHARAGKINFSVEMRIRSLSSLFWPACMMNDDTSYQEGWVAGRAQRIALNNDLDYLLRERERMMMEYDFLERMRQSSQYEVITGPGIDMK